MERCLKKLDHVFCTPNWRILHEEATAKALVRLHSDHHPILISTEGNDPPTKKPFRFEACWLRHLEFEDFIKTAWKEEEDANIMLKKLTPIILQWNKDNFGNIFRRKNRLINRIEGIQRTANHMSNRFLYKIEQKQWIHMTVGSRGPRIGHLMFADDLLLFSEASPSQIKTILDCLELFCNLSGHKINNSKTSIFFTKNTSQSTITDIISLSGFKQCSSMGKYLGTNIIHGMHSRGHYNHILEKLKKKLAGWKASCLSMAGRVSLINSVTSSIPVFHMQNYSIPQSIIQDFEKYERKFLWGEDDNKRKLHTYSWEVACTSKENRGLGIKNLSIMNKALICKTTWNLFYGPNNLCSQVITSKYQKRCKDTDKLSYKPGDSRLWKAISNNWWLDPPPSNWYKINTDGSVVGEQGMAGCGGIIRNDQGNWISGFLSFIGSCSVLDAELWGIYRGLVLVKKKGLQRVMVECDSKEAIGLIEKARALRFTNNRMVGKIFELSTNLDRVVFSYSPREANGCANWLARRSLYYSIGVKELDSPPSYLLKLMDRDKIGLPSCPREPD
ncbi:ribonuclease H [Senna tora]|uniref:Ribonuclease H n=1 Tax=Senna tora TaxID=362788 RepID=A0A834TQU7_9FABA|nr:ribonuclease H [Senna tora]